MDRYVRGEDGFEHEYVGPSCLCELGCESGAGAVDIFPAMSFVGVNQGEDVVLYLSGVSDCLPVDTAEHPFDVFRDFYFAVQKYFANADYRALLDVWEEVDGGLDRQTILKMMLEAETVYLSARCYYTLGNGDVPRLLEWTNTHLPDALRLSAADIRDRSRCEQAVAALQHLSDETDDDLPLLGLRILAAAVGHGKPEFVVHDEEDVWASPVVLEGDIVTAGTEIGEYDTPMF